MRRQLRVRHRRAQNPRLPVFGLFIANFGVKYNRRRILFVIRTINQLYSAGDDLDGRNKTPRLLDGLKRRFYRCLDALRPHDDIQFLNPSLVSQIKNLFGGVPETAVSEALLEVDAFAALHRSRAVGDVRAPQRRLPPHPAERGCRRRPGLARGVRTAGRPARTNCWSRYIGSLLGHRPAADGRGGARTPTCWRRSRSTASARTTRRPCSRPAKGRSCAAATAGFGGFFSRATRENDYLWGRLHAVERLMDLVASTAPGEIRSAGLDMQALKKRGFRTGVATRSGNGCRSPPR